MEDYLNNLKKEYEKTNATTHLKMSGWDELQKRMDLLTPRKKSLWFNFAVAFAVFMFFIGSLFAAYKTALSAVPGDVLYPVKILSEKIVEKSGGSNQIIIDHRAREIVEMSKEREVNKEALQKVVSEYKENVIEARDSGQDSERSEEAFKKKLEDHHSEFDKISLENPEIGEEIKDAREVSDHVGERDRDDD